MYTGIGAKRYIHAQFAVNIMKLSRYMIDYSINRYFSVIML